MSRPRFLADEDLRLEIVLAARRFEPALEFVTISDLGRKGSDDSQVLEFAHSDGLIVVSHDVNTLRPAAEARVRDGRGVAGLLLTSQRSKSRDVAESIVLIWAASEADEWTNRIEFVPF
jgi:hypothetical protein